MTQEEKIKFVIDRKNKKPFNIFFIFYIYVLSSLTNGLNIHEIDSH